MMFVFPAAAFAGNPDLEWKRAERGLEYVCASFDLNDTVQCISVVRYNPSRFHTEIVNDPGFEGAAPSAVTSVLAERYGGVAAINGSYFNMKELVPATYVVDDGVQEGTTAEYELFRVNGAVGIKGEKVKILPAVLPDHEADLSDCREVLAAGPVLVRDGVAVSFRDDRSGFAKRHPRSIVGIGRRGWIYLIVIDGRFPGKAAGATLDEAAGICTMLGLKDALNLDGGGSSALWLGTEGILSHPSDNKTFDHDGQRRVPNAIVIKRRDGLSDR